MKTSELSGAALDWAVGKCEGLVLRLHGVVPYSTDWAQGGAIIERERISLWARGGEWAAESFVANEEGHEEVGTTPLIAAMRCFVSSRLGDEVELPEGLK